MVIDYYKPYRFDLVLAKCVDGGRDREELLRAVSEYE